MKHLTLILALLFSFNSFSRGTFVPAINTTLKVSDPSFILSCSAGLINGCKVIRKFGINDGLQSGVKRDVWDFGASTSGNVDYTYPADGTAPIDTVSSSNATDLQPILIQGLDINGDDTTQTTTLNGQNKVLLSTPLWRIYRVINTDLQSTADRSIGFNGNVYVYEDTAIVSGVPTDPSKVRAYVFDGNNQTQMSQYTIPNGWTGFFMGGSAKLPRKLAASIEYQAWARFYGSVFRLTDTSSVNSVGTTAYTSGAYIPTIFPSKTDIVVSAESDVNGLSFAIGYNILLLQNSVWGL